jgi:hypothetical protein
MLLVGKTMPKAVTADPNDADGEMAADIRRDAGVVPMDPWPFAVPVGSLLVLIVVGIYAWFAFP